MYTYNYIYIHKNTCVYTHRQREKERERERDRHMCICVIIRHMCITLRDFFCSASWFDNPLRESGSVPKEGGWRSTIFVDAQ